MVPGQLEDLHGGVRGDEGDRTGVLSLPHALPVRLVRGRDTLGLLVDVARIVLQTVASLPVENVAYIPARHVERWCSVNCLFARFLFIPIQTARFVAKSLADFPPQHVNNFSILFYYQSVLFQHND